MIVIVTYNQSAIVLVTLRSSVITVMSLTCSAVYEQDKALYCVLSMVGSHCIKFTIGVICSPLRPLVSSRCEVYKPYTAILWFYLACWTHQRYQSLCTRPSPVKSPYYCCSRDSVYKGHSFRAHLCYCCCYCCCCCCCCCCSLLLDATASSSYKN